MVQQALQEAPIGQILRYTVQEGRLALTKV